MVNEVVGSARALVAGMAMPKIVDYPELIHMKIVNGPSLVNYEMNYSPASYVDNVDPMDVFPVDLDDPDNKDKRFFKEIHVAEGWAMVYEKYDPSTDNALPWSHTGPTAMRTRRVQGRFKFVREVE